MQYITDISDFFKMIMIQRSSNENGVVKKSFVVSKAYFCDKCFQLWSQKRRHRFSQHLDKCIGKYSIPIEVTDTLYTFDRHEASIQLPLTVYTDLEVSAEGVNGAYMIPMSYAITFSVNKKYFKTDQYLGGNR